MPVACGDRIPSPTRARTRPFGSSQLIPPTPAQQPTSGISSMRARGKIFEALGLLAIVAWATAIRWVGIGRRLWLDELTTAWVIRDSWSDIPPRAMLNNLSPLFYGMTWITTRLVG